MKTLTLTLLFVFSVFYSISYAIDDPALIFYCPFEEGSGDSVKDVRSNLVGKFRGGAKWTTKGKVGKAIEFTDATSSIEFPEDPILDITEAITMEAWILPNAVQGDSALMGRRTAANAGGYCMQWTAGKIETWIHIGGWQGTRDKQKIIPKPGEWHHVAGVFTGSEILQYVNGELDIKFSVNGKAGSVKEPFRIGQAQTGLTSMIGLIDEVAVYKRALKPEEIKSDMEKGVIAPVSPAGSLVTVWGKIKNQ